VDKVALRLKGDFIIDSKIGKELSRVIVIERQKVPYTCSIYRNCVSVIEFEV
jgi:hypothetical protein